MARFFFDGAFSGLSNPKIVLFYLAFLPRFVSSEAPHPTLMLLGLGAKLALERRT